MSEGRRFRVDVWALEGEEPRQLWTGEGAAVRIDSVGGVRTVTLGPRPGAEQEADDAERP